MRIKKETIFLLYITLVFLSSGLIGTASAAEPAKVLILPFNIHADKDLAFLRRGVADMLASRLAEKDRIVVIDKTDSALNQVQIPETINAETAVAMGERIRCDYVLFGSLTVFGNSISTDAKFYDVHRKQPALTFSEMGNSHGEVITHVNQLAVQIKAEVFGHKAVASQPAAPAPAPAPAPAAQSTGSAESASDSRMHPEKLLDKESGMRAIAADEGLAAGEINATLWKTQNFRTEIRGITIGDVDGDKNNETVFISKNELFVFRYVDRRFAKIAEFKGQAYDNFIGVDAADINANGTAEIFVTSLSDKNRARSFVLEWNGTTFKTLIEDESWYFRVIRLPDGDEPILVGQKGGYRDLFSGGIYELTWDNGRYTPADRQPLPRWVSAYGFTYGDVLNSGQQMAITFTEANLLTILDGAGAEEWTSSETYGGSNVYLLSPADKKEAETEGQILDPTAFKGQFLQQRIFVADLDQDKKNEVIVVKNHDAAGGLMTRFKQYNSGHFEGLVWDNVGLRKQWRTRKFSGYISDYDVGDLDNNGRVDLVFAVTRRTDTALTEAKSYIVSMSSN
ncbi:MAG: FG-GAP-like repeat-containing protein [Desulfobacterales bacterium]